MIQALEETSGEFLNRARAALRETFGFHSFREGQERAIEAIACGRDALVIMPTGSGKSLCYQVPALVLPGVTVVVSPLIALMKDQADSLALKGVPVTFINSSLTADEQWTRLLGLERLEYRIVYVAPERFGSRAFKNALSRVRVSLLAVDEAHCISQWGHDFRPDYRKLKEVRALLGGVPAVGLTATATPEVQEEIVCELALENPERIITGFHRPNLRLEVRKVRGESEKKEALRELILEVLRRSHDGGLPSGIIYTGTRKAATSVAAFLNSEAWPLASREEGGDRPRPLCAAYHAGLGPAERRAVQEDFMEGRLPWVAATNAFGMGVDKSDVRFVVHHSLPGSIEAYYQEVGRAGRDGRPADCLLLFAPADRRLQEFFIEGSNPDRKAIEAVYGFLFALRENPIFSSLVELEALFSGSGKSSNPLLFRSAVAVLERAGALDRLDHYEDLAEVSPLAAHPWEEDHYPGAGFKRALVEALERVFGQSGGEPARISLERWADALGMSEDSLRRGLAQLASQGVIRYLPPFRGRAIRLPDRRRPLKELGVDFQALERRRRRDWERLEEMVQFARARTCRRDIILRHFGEAVPAGGCGLCAGCRREAPRELSGAELTLVRKVLSGVARVRGRCGQKRVIQMLRGSRSGGVTSLGLDRLSTHGLLPRSTEAELQEIFDLLESAGCIQRTGERFPVIRLTHRGLQVMKGEEKLALAFPARALLGPAAPTSARAGESAEGDEENGGFDAALFEGLRRLRREIAEGLGLPAYRVFTDRTLKVMARDLPQDEESLLRVPGVGAVTLKRFGGRFLAALRFHRGAGS